MCIEILRGSIEGSTRDSLFTNAIEASENMYHCEIRINMVEFQPEMRRVAQRANMQKKFEGIIQITKLPCKISWK